MTAQIIHLQKLQSIPKGFHILKYFIIAFNVVYEAKRKFCTSRDTLNLTRISRSCETVDGILKFDFTNIRIKFQIFQIPHRGFSQR